jgi:hypothetical protein
MHIYLHHPVHGTKIATMEEEAIFDEEHGWERYTPGTLSASNATAQKNDLVSRRRRGRPPNEEVTSDDDSGRSD